MRVIRAPMGTKATPTASLRKTSCFTRIHNVINSGRGLNVLNPIHHNLCRVSLVKADHDVLTRLTNSLCLHPPLLWLWIPELVKWSHNKLSRANDSDLNLNWGTSERENRLENKCNGSFKDLVVSNNPEILELPLRSESFHAALRRILSTVRACVSVCSTCGFSFLRDCSSPSLYEWYGSEQMRWIWSGVIGDTRMKTSQEQLLFEISICS